MEEITKDIEVVESFLYRFGMNKGSALEDSFKRIVKQAKLTDPNFHVETLEDIEKDLQAQLSLTSELLRRARLAEITRISQELELQ